MHKLRIPWEHDWEVQTILQSKISNIARIVIMIDTHGPNSLSIIFYTIQVVTRQEISSIIKRDKK